MLGLPATSADTTLRFADAQEQAQALTGWNQDYRQLSAGRFHGEVRQIQGNGIRLFIETAQQMVYQKGALAANVLALGIPLTQPQGGMFCGQACDANSLHVFSGAGGFSFRSAPEFAMLGLELELKLGSGSGSGLESESGLDSANAWNIAQQLPRSAHILRLTPQHTSVLKNYLLQLFHEGTEHPQVLHAAGIAHTVADYVLDHIDGCQHHSVPTHGSSNHWGLVQESVRLIDAAGDSTPSVTALCTALEVSRRTLQNAFQNVLGMSPLSYIKTARLNRARTLLKQHYSVTQAAAACGFWHFGRFAHDFHALFGQRPSQTLRARQTVTPSTA